MSLNLTIGEQIDKRRSRTEVFYKGNGEFELKAYPSPKFYESAPGMKDWALINPAIVLRQGNYEIDHAPYAAIIPSKKSIGHTQINRGGGQVSVSLESLNDIPLRDWNPTIAPVVDGSTIRWADVVPDLDITLVAKKTKMGLNKYLKSASAPTKLTWRITESADNPYTLKETRAARDNMEDQPVSGDRLNDKVLKRRVEVLVTKGPETVNPDGSKTYTVTEEVTGRTVKISPHRIKSWAPGTIMYPVFIDVDFDPFDNTDDGKTDNPGTWDFDTGNYSYGAWCGVVGSGTSLSYVCWRFRDLEIPVGSTINSATLTVERTTFNSGGGTLGTIRGDARTDNAPAWSNSSNTKEDFTNTSSSATITLTAAGSHSVTVTDIIQDIIDASGWAYDNELRLGVTSVTATGASTWRYIEDNAMSSPTEAVLAITWTEPSGAGPIGLSLTGVGT